MNQLYFGSGANANDLQPALGLPDHAAMKRFLTDYAGILDLLAFSGNPATIHHLIELYEYLIPADPAAVFDIVHAVLLGPAAREGYHHESLANSVVVRAIRATSPTIGRSSTSRHAARGWSRSSPCPPISAGPTP